MQRLHPSVASEHCELAVHVTPQRWVICLQRPPMQWVQKSTFVLAQNVLAVHVRSQRS